MSKFHEKSKYVYDLTDLVKRSFHNTRFEEEYPNILAWINEWKNVSFSVTDMIPYENLVVRGERMENYVTIIIDECNSIVRCGASEFEREGLSEGYGSNQHDWGWVNFWNEPGFDIYKSHHWPNVDIRDMGMMIESFEACTCLGVPGLINYKWAARNRKCPEVRAFVCALSHIFRTIHNFLSQNVTDESIRHLVEKENLKNWDAYNFKIELYNKLFRN